MSVGGAGDCLAMDVVSGKDSLPLTLYNNRYIPTLIDCFTRYAYALAIPDKTSKIIINTVLSHYIMEHGTPRCILTDE